jgi:pheromone shutdown-related protein TraB
MTDETNSEMVHHLESEGKQVILVGTAHVSADSTALVEAVIRREAPDTVAVELCPSRHQSIRDRNRWQNMDIVKVIREKKAFLLLANLMLAAFQKRIAARLDVRPGEEMIRAMDVGEEIGAVVHLADRDIRVTLARVWRSMGFWKKVKLVFQLVLSFGDADEISQEDVERMKQQDVLESLLEEIGQSLPELRSVLIDERDRYLAEKIRTAPGQRIVAVVGAGHVPGIKRCWQTPIALESLETLPPKGRLVGILKWLWMLPLMILVLIGAGFFYGGMRTGADMMTWWIAANGILAGIGAIVALAHPFTIASSVLAAPLTSLNPMIAAGWVSGLVEAFSRKPKVIDFESLPEDIQSVRGFWKNKITRILLVVVFTNLGSSIGTFVAIPMMLKLL